MAIGSSTGKTLTKAGPGILTLAANNTFSGLTISAGTVSVSAGSALGTTSSVVTIDGGALRFGTTSALAAGRTFTIGANNGIIDLPASVNKLTIDGTVGGAGRLYKTGPGELVLNNAGNSFGGLTVQAGIVTLPAISHAYGGTTEVTGGHLVVKGTLASGGGAVSLGGGTLGGTGSVSRNVNVNAGGTVAPGDVGSGASRVSSAFTLSGTTTLAPGGAYAWDINAQDGSAGVNWDKLSLSAVSVTATNSPGQRFIIKLVSLDATNAPGAMTEGAGQAWDPQSGEKRWTIASFTGGLDDSLLDRFEIDTSEFDNTALGGFYLDVNGGDLDLVYVPEPTGAVTVIAMAAIALSRRQRRRE
jgi:autotransporter-associated beta strand protein